MQDDKSQATRLSGTGSRATAASACVGTRGKLPVSPLTRGSYRKRDFSGTTEGPCRVRQLDGVFLFGRELILGDPDITPIVSFGRGRDDHC